MNEIIKQLEENSKLKIGGKIEEDLKAIIDFVDKINEVDTEGVEALSYMEYSSDKHRFEKEAIKNALDLKANAPDAEGSYFVVPKSFE